MSNALGCIIVDHGSRSLESNQLLHAVVQAFIARYQGTFPIVELAHMELVKPGIADAYARCVERGAQTIVVCPFFLAPGKHMQEDIPRLAAEAASAFPGTTVTVAAPLGADDLIVQLLQKRAEAAVAELASVAASARQR
jgi:sirohydrochlorin ferrochelatase